MSETLSSKITWCPSKTGVRIAKVVEVDDIKEFIKKLKECFGVSIIGNKPYTYTAKMIYKQIDTLAGEELAGSGK